MQPVLSELAGAHGSRLVVRKVHVDREPELRKKHRADVATLVLLRADGTEYCRKYGFKSVNEILGILDEMAAE